MRCRVVAPAPSLNPVCLCFRLLDIGQTESCLKTELPQSFSVFVQHMKKRMNELTKLIDVMFPVFFSG